MIPGPIRRFLERRRFPGLMLIAAGLLAVDLLVPDALPLVDELLLLIATLALGALRKSRRDRNDGDGRVEGS